MRSSSSSCSCFLCSGLRHKSWGARHSYRPIICTSIRPGRASPRRRASTVQDGTVVPYNALISDLVLENVQWKSVITDALRSGNSADILWNPRSFAGVPFLAAGQHSAAYPLSLLFYVLPLCAGLRRLHVAPARHGRGLHVRLHAGPRRAPAWQQPRGHRFRLLRLLHRQRQLHDDHCRRRLAAAGAGLRRSDRPPAGVPRSRRRAWRPAARSPAAGARRLLSCSARSCSLLQILAGHVEITYYTLMVAAFYTRLAAGARLHAPAAGARSARGRASPARRLDLSRWSCSGLALGGVQLLPAVRPRPAELPGRLGQPAAGARLGLALPADRHLPPARLLRQSDPPRLFRHLAAARGSTVTPERAGRAAAHDRLGREELRRGRQLPGPGDAGAGRHRRGRRRLPVGGPGPQDPYVVLRGAGGPGVAVRLRHAGICDPLLRAAGLQPAPFGLPLGLPVHAGDGRAGRLRARLAPARPEQGAVAAACLAGLPVAARRAAAWPSCSPASSSPGRSSRSASDCSTGASGPTWRPPGFADGAMFWSYEAIRSPASAPWRC